MKTKQKTLMILIWNMGIGGIQKRMRDVITDILKNNPEWKVHLLVKFKKPSYFLDEIPKSKNFVVEFYSESHKKSNSLPSVFWIARKYLSIKPEICLTFLDHLSVIMGMLKIVFFWRKCRLVLNEGILTSVYLKIYRGNKAWLWKILVKLFYPLADQVIVPTEACKKDLSSNFGVDKKKLRVIHNWTLYAKAMKKEMNKKNYDLIYVGRFEKEKNVFAYLELMKNLAAKEPSIKLAMIGEGSLHDELIRRVKQERLEKNIEVINFNNQIRKYLLASKMFVLLTRNEGLPNVVLEAGMCAVPSVTTRFEGCEEVILDGKTGILIDSVNDGAVKIEKLLKDKECLEKMSRLVQDHIEDGFALNNQKNYIATVLSLS